MTNTFDLIRQWANDRNLIEGSNQAKQYGKMVDGVFVKEA